MIEVRLIGHATVQLCFGEEVLLCDPHLGASYGGGLFTYFPTRVLNVEELPRPTAIYISHRHRDHFDLASLARLNRTLPVYCPLDIEVLTALRSLGFETICPVKDWLETEFGGATLLFTPSLYRVPEHGVLVRYQDSVIWNMVDTVVDGTTLAHVQEWLQGRSLGLLLWPYQPLKETDAVEGRSLDLFPRNLSADLDVLRTLKPRSVVPYSDGQVGEGPTAWLNHYRFPVASSEIELAVKRLLPATDLWLPQPGLTLRVEESGTSRMNDCPGVVAGDSPHDLRSFDATEPAPGPADVGLHDLFPARSTLPRLFDVLESRIRRVAKAQGWTGAWWTAAHFGIAYDIVIEREEAPDAMLRWRPTDEFIRYECCPDSLPSRGRFVVRIPQGVLERLITGRMHYVTAYLGGLFRTWDSAFELTRVGLIDVPRISIMSELTDCLPSRGVLTPALFLNALISVEPDLWKHALQNDLNEVR